MMLYYSTQSDSSHPPSHYSPDYSPASPSSQHWGRGLHSTNNRFTLTQSESPTPPSQMHSNSDYHSTSPNPIHHSSSQNVSDTSSQQQQSQHQSSQNSIHTPNVNPNPQSLSQRRSYPNPVNDDNNISIPPHPFEPIYSDNIINRPINRRIVNESQSNRIRKRRSKSKKEKKPKLPSLTNNEIVFNEKIPMSVHCCHYMFTYFVKQLLYYCNQIPMPYIDVISKINADSSMTAPNKKRKNISHQIKTRKFIEKMGEMEQSVLSLLQNHIQKWDRLMRSNAMDCDLIIANHYLPIEIILLFGNIRTPTQAYSLRFYLDIRDSNTQSNVKHMKSIKKTVGRSFISIFAPLLNTRLKVTALRLACATFIESKPNGFSLMNSNNFKIGHRKNKTNIITIEFWNETIENWYKSRIQSTISANLTMSNSDMELDGDDGDDDIDSDDMSGDEIDCEMKENSDGSAIERPLIIRHDLERMIFGFNSTISPSDDVDDSDENCNLDKRLFEKKNNSEWRIWLTSAAIKGFK